MSTISRFAKGFLDLLGLQNFGEAPRALADVVSPVVDISEMYMVDAQRTLFGGTTGTLADGFTSADVSSGVPLEVPAGEVWRVLAISVTVVPPAGASGRFGPAVLIDNNSVQLSEPIDFVASTRHWTIMQVAPFWALPGYRFGFQTRQTVGLSPASLQMLVVKLRA